MPRLLVMAVSLTVATAGRGQAPPVKQKPLTGPIVWSLSFSPDGSRLAAGVTTPNRDGVVQVWDVASRKRVAKSDPLDQRLVVAEFTPDGKAIAAAHWGKAVTLLDPKTGAKAGEMGPFAVEITAVTRGARGQWVVLGTDNTFRVWD